MKKLVSLFLLIFPLITMAHEAWVMTPEQFREWSTKPIPSLFTHLNFINSSLAGLTIIGIGVYYLISKSSLANFFPKFQTYFENNYHFSLLFLRLGMAITLIIAGFGMIPRRGFEEIYIPTLFVADLQLSWQVAWIKWIELFAALCLILGIYVRLMGLLLLIGLAFAFYQFGSTVFYYAGYIAGISLAFILMGGGKFAMTTSHYNQTQGMLGLVILRISMGLNFMYGGIFYKFMHPNIDIGMLTIHDSFTFGLGPQIFTLLMAYVETALGILLILGKLIRPLTVIILGLFIGMGMLVHENIFAHTFIIGALCALFLNGGGYHQIDNKRANYV